MSHSPRRIASKSELDCAGSRGAGGRDRNRQSLRPELLGDSVRDPAEQERLVELAEFSAFGGVYQSRDDHRLRGVAIGRQLAPLRPLHLDRRHGGEQRSREVALGAGSGFGNRFFDRERRQRMRQDRSADRLVEQEVDRAGDLGLQSLGRETLDLVDARYAGGELLPVVFLAASERSDDTEARRHHDRAAFGITIIVRSHQFSPRFIEPLPPGRRLRPANVRHMSR